MPRPHCFIKLTKAQEAELLALIQESRKQKPPDLRAVWRAQAILLSHHGQTLRQISQNFKVSRRILFAWFKRYREKGPAGLVGRIKGGRYLKQALTAEPTAPGMDQPLRPVMTLSEVARYLRVSNYTLYRLVTAGKLAAFKVGGQWRFRKEAVFNYATSQTYARFRQRNKEFAAGRLAPREGNKS